MKKGLLIFLLLFAVMFFSGCTIENEFLVRRIDEAEYYVGETLNYHNIQFENAHNILENIDDAVICRNPGYIVIECDEGQILIHVIDDILSINATASQQITIGESISIITSILPTSADQRVTFTSTDPSIIVVDEEGIVTAVNYGLARVIISSVKNPKKTKELTFIINEEDEQNYAKIIRTIIDNDNTEIQFNDYNGILLPIIESNISSIIGISCYGTQNGAVINTTFASGVVYRCDAILKDGTNIRNFTDFNNLQNVSNFRYYVITNRHIVKDEQNIKVYLGSEHNEIPAKLMEYDEKIDLAVISFESALYVPTAKIGNSDEVVSGEFILSMGNSQGKNYFRSIVFGVVSHPNRYISDDTDGDGVGDWDAQYIQHDASLNESDSGGALVNMSGEIIGINTTKISVSSYNNMSFAIPINLVMEIVKQLEEGISPKRATLGVEILDVKAYHANKEYYQSYYPGLTIDSSIKYGFYISKVNDGGVASQANVQVGDIMVEFNGVAIRYSYLVRAELGKFLIGSGEQTTIKVIRNGEITILTVTF